MLTVDGGQIEELHIEGHEDGNAERGSLRHVGGCGIFLGAARRGSWGVTRDSRGNSVTLTGKPGDGDQDLSVSALLSSVSTRRGRRDGICTLELNTSPYLMAFSHLTRRTSHSLLGSALGGSISCGVAQSQGSRAGGEQVLAQSRPGPGRGPDCDRTTAPRRPEGLRRLLRVKTETPAPVSRGPRLALRRPSWPSTKARGRQGLHTENARQKTNI